MRVLSTCGSFVLCIALRTTRSREGTRHRILLVPEEGCDVSLTPHTTAVMMHPLSISLEKLDAIVTSISTRKPQRCEPDAVSDIGKSREAGRIDSLVGEILEVRRKASGTRVEH